MCNKKLMTNLIISTYNLWLGFQEFDSRLLVAALCWLDGLEVMGWRGFTTSLDLVGLGCGTSLE